MRISLRNILKVKEADIALDGLTVLTGENDSGKSTVGKALFAMVKSLSFTAQNDMEARFDRYAKLLESLFARLRPYRNSELEISKEIFDYRNIRALERHPVSIDEFGRFADKVAQFAQEVRIPPRSFSAIEKDLDNMMLCLTQYDDNASMFKTELSYLIESEFMNNINSYGQDIAEMSLSFEDGTKAWAKLCNNNVVGVAADQCDCVQDATYVESPLYLHLIDSIMSSSTYREIAERRVPLYAIRGTASYHIKDFVNKIRSMRYAQFPGEETSKGELADIMGGEFCYDKESRSIVFSKDGRRINPLNVASGVKSLGVIQMLLQTEAISRDRLLIWDEPENHLHPQWQVKFAELMVRLQASGIRVVVSTHSPYFIQSIRYYSAKYHIENSVRYYWAEQGDDGLAVFEDVSHDLNTVFVRLAAPLNEVMNVDEARNS